MRFDIEIVGFDAAPPVLALARTFEIDVEEARSLVARTPLIVKRDVDEKMAEAYFHTLRELGARVKLHKRATAPPTKSVPPPARPTEIELDASFAPLEQARRSAPPPSAADIAAIPDLAIELDDVPRRSAWPAPVSVAPPPAATAQVTRAPTHGPVERELEHKGGFIEAVARAYLYPFQKTALPAIVAVPLITQLFGYLPMAIGLILSNAIWISYLFAVTQHASLGRSDLPLAPETETWLDTVKPLVRYVLALAVPGALIFGLFALLTVGTAGADRMVTGGQLTDAGVPILVVVALGVWLLYLPASLILAAHSQGCLGGLNLIAGVKLIVREPVGYVITLVGIAPAALLVVLVGIGAEIADSMIPIPFVPGFVGLILTFVPALVVARILGLYLWHHEEELGIG